MEIVYNADGCVAVTEDYVHGCGDGEKQEPEVGGADGEVSGN